MKVPWPLRAIPRLAVTAWFTPPPIGSGTIRRDVGEVGDLCPVHFGGVPGFEIGQGPLVLAVHGWGGRPAQMAPIARRLAAEGHRVIVPRIPGHAGGRQTDIKQAASAVDAVIEDVGEPGLVVGHSFASMVLRLVFDDAAPGRIALVAPAVNVYDALDVFSERLDLFPWTRRSLYTGLETWDRDLWPVLSTLRPGQFPGAELLILHDPEDTETPFTRSAELAAIRPHTSIVAVDGAGHSRILSHPRALDELSRFAEEPTAADSAA